jgi:hypothetical protein
MKQLKYLVLWVCLIIVCLSNLSFGQRVVTPTNTVLYLKMDKSKARKHTSDWLTFKDKQRKGYWYHNYYWREFEFTFS